VFGFEHTLPVAFYFQSYVIKRSKELIVKLIVMKTQKQRETFIAHMLNKGFENAAHSFSKIVNRNVKISASSLVIRHECDFSFASEGKDEVYVLITHLMGDFPGKSYLIITQEEAEEIFKSVFASKDRLDQSLQDALLLEIDNILSASVISAVSNEMNALVYGDVPKLKKMHSDELSEFLNSNEAHENNSIVYSNAIFKFDNREKIHPQFIWNLSARVFDLVPDSNVKAA